MFTTMKIFSKKRQKQVFFIVSLAKTINNTHNFFSNHILNEVLGLTKT